jgi:hypothetical protein
MTSARRRLRSITVLVCAVLVCGAAPASAAAARSWYVSAAASSGGDGSASQPFNSLAAAQSASAAGDTIVVLPSPSSTRPLDGGITLKPGQRLVGAGPSVIGVPASSPAPRIENATSAQNSGDAVVLADGATVSNIAVVGAYLGGIYGSNVNGVKVNGNDVTATNSSCTTGFVVQPFNVPSSVPGVGTPFSNGLNNGWAAIMVDESIGTSQLQLTKNFVHDENCADGIDVRASGSADVAARIDRNKLTRLRLGDTMNSLLAIGVQTIGHSRLTAWVDSNKETYIGSVEADNNPEPYTGGVIDGLARLGLHWADTEGLFGNTAGPSTLIEHIDHNVYTHGLGSLSANGLEEAASNNTGGAPTQEITVKNSTFYDVPGDMIEAANLSTAATMTMRLDNVLVRKTTYVASEAQAPVLPGDDGDCLLEVAAGSASTTSVSINHSKMTGCAGDGLGLVSNVVDGTNLPVKSLSFDVGDSQVSGNRLSNLRVENVTGVQQLDGKIQDTNLSQSLGTPVILANPYSALHTGETTNLDLGGGALGSTGHNCIYGGKQTDAYTVNYHLDAENDWWGQPNGPRPGQTAAVGGTITDTPALTEADCGPRPSHMKRP